MALKLSKTWTEAVYSIQEKKGILLLMLTLIY